MSEKPNEKELAIIPAEVIERKIYLIRGHKVMLDRDLAALYQVPTKAFNQAIKRNIDRFPGDFMFQLSQEESSALRSQIVTLEKGAGDIPSTRRMPSLSSVWRCSRPFSTAITPCR